jgi:hypothetical protein
MSSKGKEGYEIWDGYFENLLRGCYSEKINKGGILYGYMTQEEWCDESPWKIENLSLAIEELKLFSEDNIPEASIMFEELRNIQLKLLSLLEYASKHRHNAYIEYI